jgi:hypothetical protein
MSSYSYASNKCDTTDSVIKFQQIFRSIVPQSTTDEAFQMINLIPPKAWYDVTGLNNLSTIVKDESPLKAYELAAQSECKAGTLLSTSEIDNNLLAGRNINDPFDRVTVILIPGIFGEFIETKAFTEILDNKNSKFRSAWQQKISNNSSTNSTDPSYTLKSIEKSEVSLDKLITTSSIDDANGNNLVNVILLETPPLSLESLDHITTISEMFNRRINKFMEIIDYKSHNYFPITLVGYSRGAIIGLEMLSQLTDVKTKKFDEHKMLWSHQIKSLNTIGGVIYGSDVADTAIEAKNFDYVSNSNSSDNPNAILNSKSGRQFKAMKQLQADLMSSIPSDSAISKLPEALQRIALYEHNMKAYKTFFQSMIDTFIEQQKNQLKMATELGLSKEGYKADFTFINESLKKLFDGSLLEKVKSDLTNGIPFVIDNKLNTNSETVKAGELLVSSIIEKLAEKTAPYRYLDYNILMTNAFNVIFNNLKLQYPLSDYENNVIKFKDVLHKMLVGIEELTSKERKLWWNKHIIPNSVKYYAIAGTMSEKYFLNAYAYNNKVYDDISLIGSYRDFSNFSKVFINDSQVGFNKANFFPQVHKELNKNQPEISASNLGLMGTHHWGMALEVVYAPNSKEEYDLKTDPYSHNRVLREKGDTNPFPRAALLKSLVYNTVIDTVTEQQTGYLF